MTVDGIDHPAVDLSGPPGLSSTCAGRSDTGRCRAARHGGGRFRRRQLLPDEAPCPAHGPTLLEARRRAAPSRSSMCRREIDGEAQREIRTGIHIFDLAESTLSEVPQTEGAGGADLGQATASSTGCHRPGDATEPGGVADGSTTLVAPSRPDADDALSPRRSRLPSRLVRRHETLLFLRRAGDCRTCRRFRSRMASTTPATDRGRRRVTSLVAGWRRLSCSLPTAACACGPRSTGGELAETRPSIRAERHLRSAGLGHPLTRVAVGRTR